MGNFVTETKCSSGAKTKRVDVESENEGHWFLGFQPKSQVGWYKFWGVDKDVIQSVISIY